MEWRAYFSIGDELNYRTFQGTYDEVKEQAVRFERAIEEYPEEPVKFVGVFGVVTVTDIRAALRPPR